MPKAEFGDKPEKQRARKVIHEITVRALGGLLGRLLGDAIRELINRLSS